MFPLIPAKGISLPILVAIMIAIGIGYYAGNPVMLTILCLLIAFPVLLCHMSGTSLEKITFIGVAIVLFYLPFYLPIRFSLGNPWFFPVVHSVLFFIFFGIALPNLFGPLMCRWNSLDVLMLMYLAWSITTAVLTVPRAGVEGALYYGLRIHFIEGLLYFIVRVLKTKHTMHLLRIFIVVVMVQAVYNIFLLIVMKSLGLAGPEWMVAYQEVTGSTLHEVWSSGGGRAGLRLGGFFGSGNASALLMAVGTLLAFSKGYVGIVKNLGAKLIFLVLFPSTLIAGSRTVSVLLVGVLVLLAFVAWKKRLLSVTSGAVIISGVCIVFIMALVLLNPYFSDLRYTYLDNFGVALEIQNNAMDDLMNVYIGLVRDNPLVFFGGTGFPPFPFDPNYQRFGVLMSPDSPFIELLAVSGFVGMLIFIGINTCAVRLSMLMLRRRVEPEIILGCIGAVLILALSLYHRKSFYRVGIHVWYFVFLAIISSYRSILFNDQKGKNRHGRNSTAT